MLKIRWRLIMLLALNGFAFAALTIFAVISGIEHWVMLIMLAGIAVAAATRAPEAPLINAFFAGFFALLCAVWTQAVFLQTYFENNPVYRSIDIPFGLDPQLYILLIAPVGACVSGLFTQLIAWLVTRLK